VGAQARARRHVASEVTALKKLLEAIAIIGILLAAAFGGFFGKEIGKEAGTAVTPRAPSKEDVKAKVMEGFLAGANQWNQKLPMMVDQETRLDKVTVQAGTRAVYHHTLIRYASRDIEPNWLRGNVRPGVVRNVCGSNGMTKSLQYGGIYVYAYYGTDGIEITRFQVDRTDCGLASLP
jgi:hypothetical protein